MSRAVHINFELLKAIVYLKPQARLSLLRVADRSLVTAVCECALNILKGKVPVTDTQRKRLSKEKESIRSLSRSKGSWKSKRILIVKKSDTVIPLIISIALEFLKNESSQKDGVDIA